LRRETAVAGAAALLLACGTPGVRGAAGTAPAPNVLWTPPVQPAVRPAQPPPALPADLAERIAQLNLADVIDIALRNNTATTAAWADARAAAAGYGAAKGQYYPTIAVNGTATTIHRTVPAAGQQAVKQQFYGPALTLSWLLFDFGGRSGSVGEARAALLAADWTHNATLQSVVLAVEQAFFQYMGTKALLEAQQTTLAEAQANLDAAEQRHRVGLATIADVLQARTALSQARLALESTQGDLQTTRGALALSMGLPANVPYDIVVLPDTTLPLGVIEGVDTLIARAVRERPDLAAQRELVEQAHARVSVARSQALPTLALGGNAGQTYFINPPAGSATSGNSYTATLTLSIPLFSGWSQIYNVKAASAAADAAARRAEGFEQQVVYEVFNAYYALRTATQLVRTSRDLLASATESEQVALGRYKAGAGSLLDLLTAQSALASARAQAIQARFSWNTALAQLAHDVGILGLDGSSPLHVQPDTTGTPK
jgi:TolC family type I secretion outer membrane protein